MSRKRAPRLAAAFVVTISAGCGGASSEPVTPDGPGDSPPAERFYKDSDGKCYIEHFANPPYRNEVDCSQDPAKPPESPDAKPDSPDGPDAIVQQPDERVLKPAPDGWRVERNEEGSCTAYGPDPCQHQGCNPPPPRKVLCPPELKGPAPKR